MLLLLLLLLEPATQWVVHPSYSDCPVSRVSHHPRARHPSNRPHINVPLADAADVDWVLQPMVQSGGNFTLQVANATATSSASRLSDDVIIYSAAMKYKTQLAFVGRTFLIDPTPSQLGAYEALLDAQASLIDKLRPGAVISEVRKCARGAARQHRGVRGAATMISSCSPPQTPSFRSRHRTLRCRSLRRSLSH